MNDKKHSLLPGIILILIGCWFLGDRFYPEYAQWEKLYPFLLIGLGGFQLYEFKSAKKRQGLLWGVFFSLAGIFFLLRNFDVIPYLYFDEYWPIFLGAWGCGFIALYAIKPDDWGNLIAASVFLSLCFILLSSTAGEIIPFLDFDLERYWPVLLILIGTGIVLSALKKTSGDEGRGLG